MVPKALSANTHGHLLLVLVVCGSLRPAATQSLRVVNADELKGEWARTETQTLPLVEKLSSDDPCGNESAITARISAIRAAADRYFSTESMELGLDASYKSTVGDLDLLKKTEIGILAHQTQADAKAFADAIRAADTLLANTVQRAESGRQLFDLERKLADLKYATILQRRQVACMSRRAPDELQGTKNAGVTPTAPPPAVPREAQRHLGGMWRFISSGPTQPYSVGLDVIDDGDRLTGEFAVSGAPKAWQLPALLECSIDGPITLRPFRGYEFACGPDAVLELLPWHKSDGSEAARGIEVILRNKKGDIVFDNILSRYESEPGQMGAQRDSGSRLSLLPG
jgi:hypothetical protein